MIRPLIISVITNVIMKRIVRVKHTLNNPSTENIRLKIVNTARMIRRSVRSESMISQG